MGALYRSDLLDYAKREIELTGWLDSAGKYKDEKKELICENVLSLLKAFLGVTHTVETAAYVRDFFNRLTGFMPITPLTGENNEWKLWMDGFCGDLYQNVRCYTVYKKGMDGQAYNNAAVFFWKWVVRELSEGEVGYPGMGVDKQYFTKDGESARNITFPYVVREEPVYIFFPTDKYPNEYNEKAPADRRTIMLLGAWATNES